MLDVRRVERTKSALPPRWNLGWKEVAADVAAGSAKSDLSLAHDCATDIHVRFRIQGTLPQSHDGAFQVLKTIRSSRTFVFDLREAVYVERMERRLFDGDAPSPSTDDMLSSEVVAV